MVFLRLSNANMKFTIIEQLFHERVLDMSWLSNKRE